MRRKGQKQRQLDILWKQEQGWRPKVHGQHLQAAKPAQAAPAVRQSRANFRASLHVKSHVECYVQRYSFSLSLFFVTVVL